MTEPRRETAEQAKVADYSWRMVRQERERYDWRAPTDTPPTTPGEPA